MAREVVYTDDLTGEAGAEPVKFGWNEVWFEIDLTEDSRTKLEELLTPYLDAGHPAGPSSLPVPRAARLRAATEKIDYSQPEHAGNPHKGRVSPAEAEYVREHLEAVNRRLKAEGLREIDASDAKVAERYGL